MHYVPSEGAPGGDSEQLASRDSRPNSIALDTESEDNNGHPVRLDMGDVLNCQLPGVVVGNEESSNSKAAVRRPGNVHPTHKASVEPETTTPITRPAEAARDQLAVQRLRSLPSQVVHGLAVFLLALADVLFACFNRESRVGLVHAIILGCSLAVLYLCLGLCLCLRALSRRHSILAALHAFAAFVSAWWRDTLQPQQGVPGARAACTVGATQLLVAMLYTADTRSLAAVSAVSAVVLVVAEVLRSTAAPTIIDNVLALAALGLAATLTTLRWAESPATIEGEVMPAPVPLEGVPSGAVEYFEQTLGERQAQGLARIEVLPPVRSPSRGPSLTGSGGSEVGSREQGDSPSIASHLEVERKSSSAKQSTPKRSPRAGTPGSGTFTPSGSRPSQRTVHSGNSPRRTPDTSPGGSQKLGAQWKPGSPRLLVKKPLPDKLIDKRSRRLPSLRPNRPAEEEDRAEQSGTTYEQGVEDMMEALCRSEESLPILLQLDDDVQSLINKDLGLWQFPIFELNEVTNSRPLIALACGALASIVRTLSLSHQHTQSFFCSIESRYVNVNQYHNSMHGADVMNNMFYFLHLRSTPFVQVEPVECLAALVGAAAHDVGHPGLTNPFQRLAETPLARLYNDQSPLENLHCAITFSVLQVHSCNFLATLDTPARSTFKNIVTQMILDTDLAKHNQCVSQFNKAFLQSGISADDQLSPGPRKDLLSMALKCCDVAHSTKPFDLHVCWTLRINAEFFHQGDTERRLGMPCQPFCDRSATAVAESQRGFYKFIVTPLFTAVYRFLGNRRLQEEIMECLESNTRFWEFYDGSGFDYMDPMTNMEMLQELFFEHMMQSVQASARSEGDEKSGSAGSVRRTHSNTSLKKK